jgi:hypothetical protein
VLIDGTGQMGARQGKKTCPQAVQLVKLVNSVPIIPFYSKQDYEAKKHGAKKIDLAPLLYSNHYPLLAFVTFGTIINPNIDIEVR